MDDLSRAREEWEKRTLEPTLRRFPERHERFETLSDIPLDRIYTPLMCW